MHVDDGSRLDRFVRPAERLPLARSVAAGAKAGAIGGMVMVFVLLWQGSPMPFRIAAYVITRDTGFADSLVGLVASASLYMLCSIGLGAVYGALMARLIGRTHVLQAAGCGVVFGLLTWIIGQYVVVGFVAPNLVIVNDQPLLALAHSIYGLTLGVLSSPTNGLSWWYRAQCRRWQ